jgi:6-pyruvoyltetrahydropterin/6-carboxytetrahydropterin synthase
MNDRVYETGTSIIVRGFHVMPGRPPPEGERHAHDYRLDVLVRRDDLDEHGVVVDLELLDEALRGIADKVRRADLEDVVAVGAEPVSVEVFARWTHGQVASAVGSLPGASLRVRVWESPTAYGGYAAPLPS